MTDADTNLTADDQKKNAMTRTREIAKFFCGFETFHALVHGYLWSSGTDLTVLGIHVTSAWNLIGLVLNATIALALGMWAWRGRSAS